MKTKVTLAFRSGNDLYQRKAGVFVTDTKGHKNRKDRRDSKKALRNYM